MSQDSSGSWGTKEWFDRKLNSQSAENTSSYYSHGANGYQIFRHRILAEILFESLGGKGLNVILDVGCGTGHFIDMIRMKWNSQKAYGFDFVEKLIDLAKSLNPNVEFRVNALPIIDIAKNRVDLVVASEVLYYLNDADQNQTIINIHNVLNHKGYFYMTSKIGGKYYNDKEFGRYIAPYFVEEYRTYLHNGLYNKLVFPLRAAQLIYQGLDKNISDGKLGGLYKRFPFIRTNRIFRYSWKVLNGLSAPILRSSKLPFICHYLTKMLSFGRTGSNIVILYKKLD